MRKLGFVVVLLLGFSVLMGAQDFSKIFEKVRDKHFVKIEVDFPKPDNPEEVKTGNCSGVVVGLRRVLTARHCFFDPHVEESEPWKARVNGKSVLLLKYGPRDLALIEADTKGKTPIEIPFVGPKPGQMVLHIGQAAGDDQISVSPMWVMSYEENVMFTNQNIYQGYSGGPVVDVQGRLAGIQVATNFDLGFAVSIPIADIRTFLYGDHIESHEATGQAGLRRGGFGDIIR